MHPPYWLCVVILLITPNKSRRKLHTNSLVDEWQHDYFHAKAMIQLFENDDFYCCASDYG
jgi:hypothetical protein